LRAKLRQDQALADDEEVELELLSDGQRFEARVDATVDPSDAFELDQADDVRPREQDRAFLPGEGVKRSPARKVDPLDRSRGTGNRQERGRLDAPSMRAKAPRPTRRSRRVDRAFFRNFYDLSTNDLTGGGFFRKIRVPAWERRFSQGRTGASADFSPRGAVPQPTRIVGGQMNGTAMLEFRNQWHGRVRLPARQLTQDTEWCEVRESEGWRRIRFHDYAEIFSRPMLYDYLFYGLLRCRSPQRVVGLLEEVRREHGLRERPLRVIDLGAGNGIVGEELKKHDAEHIVGVDILPEARKAAKRERSHVYDDYLVGDLTEPSDEMLEGLAKAGANCLACVAALGFGDIPPLAYYNALKFVEIGGHIAFNIKDEFLHARYTHGFAELIRRAQTDGVLRFEAMRRYQHRLSTAGEPIFYTAIVATKLKDIPASMLVDAS
jgi:predicted TPR repeat methyltransferase